MTSPKFFKIFLLCLQFPCCCVGSFEGAKISRSFNGAILFQENARLLHHEIVTITVASAISCGHACLAHPYCISTNLETKPQSQNMLCQLNDFGISHLSQTQDQKHLQVQKGFFYTQYLTKNVSRKRFFDYLLNRFRN